jgi:uncharacterized protein (DUF433 family)
MVLDILLKIVLILLATVGIIAPAATATNPAIRAYSIRSCPCVSRHTIARSAKFEIRFTVVLRPSSGLFSIGHFSSAPNVSFGQRTARTSGDGGRYFFSRRAFPSIVITVTEIGSLISRHPDIRVGRPCVAGTGVSVRRIAQWHNMGLIPEEIARKFGHLSLAQVHAALTYYHANQSEIDVDLETETRETEALEHQHKR